MSSQIVPRVFCVPDPECRVAAVLEKRPRQWWRIGRWDLSSGEYTRGSWFNGSLYPQRCDLSAGGRWFLYFALKPNSDWPAGETYTAISRLPWLKALAAWRESGTWSRGAHFVPDRDAWEGGDPTVGDATPCRTVSGIRWTQPAQFAVERRRGWVESATTPPRGPNDMWDERRAVVMEKARPGKGRPMTLTVRGMFEAFRELPNHWPPSASPYCLHGKKGALELPGVQWADWTWRGYLATATAAVLRIQDLEQDRMIREVRLPDDEPQRCPPPEWASEW
jgi:hypothetical protein